MSAYKLRPYQQGLFENTIMSLALGKKTVLAAAPSAGKTLMASRVIEEHVSEGKRVLVLAHGTKVLKTQFYKAFTKYCPELKSETTIAPSADMRKKSVLIGIPQGLKNSVGKLGKIDLLVVDEAHEFYFAETVQNLVKELEVKSVLCLTGTPSKFVLENKVNPGSFDMVILSLSEIPAENLANTRIRIKPIDGDISLDEFNSESDVVSSYKKDYKESFLQECLDEISPKMFPLLIAARNVKQALVIKKILSKRSYNVGASTSENDMDSSKIDDFVSGKIDILVVVRRGILGFDMPEMKTVIDLTLSRNINRMYQLFARVLRKSKDDMKKEYIKVSPKSILSSYKLATNCMLHLAHPDWIASYDGKSINNLNLSSGSGSSESGGGGCRNSITIDSDPNLGLEVSYDFFSSSLRSDPLTVSVGDLRISLGEKSQFKDPDKRKRIILDYALAGNPRPSTGMEGEIKILAQNLIRFTAAGSPYFDPELKRELQNIAPEWFEDRSAKRKMELLDLARSGGSRPDPNSKNEEERILGRTLESYAFKSSHSYDADFCRELRLVAPEWFRESRVANLKNQLLEMAMSGKEKPSYQKQKKLYHCLINYTNESSRSYDSVFAEQVREANPEWLINSKGKQSVIKNLKNLILEKAKNGEPKPRRKSLDLHERNLSQTITRLTSNNSSYLDPEFKEELMGIRPDWFLNKK